jgi:ATP-dependent DNA helicase II
MKVRGRKLFGAQPKKVSKMNSGFEPNPAELFAFLSDEGVQDAGEGEDQEVGLSEKGFVEMGKGAVLFCVDCSDMEKLSTAEISRTFSLIAKYMRNQIIASDGSELTGVILYNVGETKNPLRQRGIYLLQDVSGLTARRIHEISDISRLDYEAFSDRFKGMTNDTDISELIFVCNAQFRKLSAAYTPRILIFTNRDEPCGTDRRAIHAAVTRAEDFHNAFPGSQIQLCPFSDDREFDISKFWDEILRMDAENFNENAQDFRSDVEDRTLKKMFRKRPVNRINLFLSDSAPPVGLMMYTSFFPASKPKHIYLDPESKKPLRAETRYVSDMTGGLLDPDRAAGQIQTFVDFNGSQVPLSRLDVLEIRKLWPSPKSSVSGNLELVGFVSASSFMRPEYCVGHSCFLYPQESRVAGSAEMVSGLIDVMLSKDLVAIGRAVPKANSSMNFVALIPHSEVLAKGFYMLRLPFADDIRDLALPNTNVATLMATYEEQERVRQNHVAHAKQIVEAMTEPHWEPEMLENPSLRVCFATLENLAVGVPAVDDFVDQVHPDSAKVTVADELARDWLGSMGLDSTDSIAANARPARYQPPKKENARQWTEPEIKQLISAGTLNKLTIAELQSVIERFESLKHLSIKGAKTELIKKITLNLK